MWALEVLNYHYFLNYCANKGNSSVLFPDSGIAKTFQMASTKASYIVYYGLAPQFKEMLLDNLKEVPFIVLYFDESYNSVKGQMDVLLRYWDVNFNLKINALYVSSEFMSDAAAGDVLVKFESASSDLNKSKFIQVSSDGPNVKI